jgi:ectoine hydroxylase-related dioxygenase (phytanoyl-CoA dioxygenase family)
MSQGDSAGEDLLSRPIRTHVVLQYDTQRFPFAAILRREVYPVPDLARLHEHARAARRARGQSDRLRTRDNLTARSLLQELPDDSRFVRLYHAFMAAVLAPLVGRPLSYSNRPKMRVHFPGTDSVSSMHADVPVTKRPDQINFWMPFTDVSESATLWLESDYGLEDYAPLALRYGQVLIFDGGYLGHGSVANETDVTRISLDMRFSFKGATTRVESIELMNRLVRRLERLRAARATGG